VECPLFPGCPDFFNEIETQTASSARSVKIGAARIWAMPLVDLVDFVRRWINEDPLALLCDNPRCSRCMAVRRSVALTRAQVGL
jgi:hypothetical protein